VRGTVATLVVIVALGAAGAALAGPEASKPSLRILDAAQLTVRGTSFKPGERVKLLINAGTPMTKAVKAGPRGGFTARLGVRMNNATVVVQAIGTRGSRAMVDVTAPHGSRPGCNELP
jgi:hypothetical protein